MAGIFSRFFGSSVSVAAGVAIGGSVQNSLNPLTQALANETWSLHPDVPPDAVLLAIGVAQGQVSDAEASVWAAQLGYGGPQFTAMKAIADTGPGVAQAFDLWRRNLINEGGFRRACKREALEQEWTDALVQLKRRLLSPAELANAVVQGFRTEAAAAADAELQGYDAADFQTMVDVTGLPPGPETLLEWLRRGIINDAELQQGIREGHTKVKYIPFYEAARSRVLSAATYAGLHLRGWISEAEMNAGGALTGYRPEDMNRLFLDRGRPATTHQVHIGWARGGRHAGSADERAAFSKAIKESDIRPEWEDILWAQRYTYPSAFVLRALVTDGTFTQAQGEQILLESGWRPDLAHDAALKWSQGSAGATGKSETKSELADEYQAGFISESEYRAALTALGFTGHQQDLEVLHADATAVKTERNRVVTALHKLFVAHTIDETQARADLAQVGMQPPAIDRIMPLWVLERDAERKQLTAAEIRREYRANAIPLTQALAELENRGYSATDAARYLAE